jgi:hypothetical protein
VTIKRAFEAIKEEMTNNKMPVEDFLIFLGILYTLHAEETGVDGTHCHVKTELAKREGRLKMIREVRESNVVLRAPRPRPLELKEGKRATQEDAKVEFYYRSLGVTMGGLCVEIIEAMVYSDAFLRVYSRPVHITIGATVTTASPPILVTIVSQPALAVTKPPQSGPIRNPPENAMLNSA